MKVGVFSRAEAQRTRRNIAKEPIPLRPPRLCARNKTPQNLKTKQVTLKFNNFVATLSKNANFGYTVSLFLL